MADATAETTYDCDVLVTDVPDDVLEFIYLYALRLANFADGKKSEVTAETLKPFLHNGKGQAEPPAAGQRSKTLRLPAKRDAAAGDGRAVA